MGSVENTKIAVKELFKGLSLIQPMIFILEDIHWLDEESRQVIKELTRNVAQYPFLIFAASRFNDDGSKPNLDLTNHVIQHEIVLDSLPAKTINPFVTQCPLYRPNLVLSFFF